MGMYDSVDVQCPKCGDTMQFQSKVGECFLSNFTIDHVPPEIANDLNNKSEICAKCNSIVVLTIKKIQFVEMEVEVI